MANNEHLLTFELSEDGDELEIHCNNRGLEELLRVCQRLEGSRGNDHEHLTTPSWGGHELSEEKQGQSNTLLNKVTIRFWV